MRSSILEARTFLARPVAASLYAIGALLGAMLLPALAEAQAAGEWRNAQQMFDATCAYCHGAGVADELRGRDFPPEYIGVVIRHGVRGMPAFRPSDFSDADIAALAAMIASSPKPEAPRKKGEVR